MAETLKSTDEATTDEDLVPVTEPAVVEPEAPRTLTLTTCDVCNRSHAAESCPHCGYQP